MVSQEYDDITIVEVWKKAEPVNKFELYKKDIYGSLMFFDDYGTLSENGWVIASLRSEGGNNSAGNKKLQPVHWKNYVQLKKSKTQ